MPIADPKLYSIHRAEDRIVDADKESTTRISAFQKKSLDKNVLFALTALAVPVHGVMAKLPNKLSEEYSTVAAFNNAVNNNLRRCRASFHKSKEGPEVFRRNQSSHE